MSEQQSAASPTEPSSSVSSTDRAYITNTSWDISASHIQAPVITDSRYHMTHVTGSPSWGGSAHLPSLVSGDSYNPRVSINPESYTRSSIETGESFGSTFQLEGYKRVDLPHRLDYRVSGLMPSSSRPQLASEEYTRTSSNQECYRNYATAYDETRSSVSHSTQYRVVPGPSAYSRSNTEESYPRQQVESGFYLRNDPGHKTLVQADLPTDTGYNKGLTHERYSTSNAEPEDYSKGKHGAETHLDPGLESDTNSASDQSNNSLRRYDGEPIDVTASEGRDTEDTAHTKSTCSVSTTAVSDNQNATHTQSESTDKHGSKMILYPESSGTTQSGFCAVESISETDTETVRDKAISAEPKTNHRFTYGANASVQSGPISASTHEIRHSVQGPNRTVPHSLMVESTPSSSPQTNADKDLCKDMRENLGTSFESNRGCLTGDTFNKAAEEEGCIPADATETLSPHSDQSTKESFKLSISQIQEIHQFKTNHPEAKCKEIAEHFSENWGLNVPSEIIRDVLNMNKQEGIQILEKEIRAEELSHEMKKAIMSYKEHCASTSLVDIAKHFSKKWNAVLRDDVIINILNEFLKPTGVVTNEEKKADEMNNAEEEKQDISSEKKSEILQYKERNQKMTTEEIAAHFSKKWQTEITKDEIVDILNDHKDALSIASSISAEHSNTTSSLHLPRKKTVLMSDDHRLVDTSGQSYYNDDVTRFVPVTPGEAREGLMKAIAYFMANPSIANGYVQTLWSIVKYIDSHDENGNVSEKEPSSDSEGFSHEEFVKIKQEVSEAESSFVSDTTTAEEIKLDNIPTSDPVRHLRKPMQQKPFKATSRYNRHSTMQKNCSTRKRVSNVQNHVEGDKDQHNSDNKADDVRIDISQKLHCPECDQCFTEFTLLLDHITRHSEEKLLMAHVCSQEDTTIVRPKTSGRNRGHPRFLAGESTLQSIKSENDTDISPKRKRRIKLQNCTLCGRQFNDYSNFRRHMRLHAGLKPHKCPTCGVSFIESNALKKHMRTHTGEKPFLCTTCGKRVTTLAGLQSHARLHTGEKPFKCSVCGKDFAQSSSLKRHMVIHTGERPYSCPQCGKSFPRSEDLKMHIRTHTGQKPYKCLVCGKCFIKSSYLQKHARIHTGEKPYKCSTCGEAFAQSDILAKHIRVHTGERPYCCTVCGKTFTQSGSLYHHMKMHKQQQQTSVDQQKQKATLGLPEHADSDITPLSESVKMQHNNDAKLSALSQPLSDSDTAPQVRVFSDIPRHYLSQWRPY